MQPLCRDLPRSGERRKSQDQAAVANESTLLAKGAMRHSLPGEFKQAISPLAVLRHAADSGSRAVARAMISPTPTLIRGPEDFTPEFQRQSGFWEYPVLIRLL
jgi:hypothetical protein